MTIDDLMTVAKTATTPESHPGLYLYTGITHLEYFTTASVERLQADAERQHEAIWPFVRNLIAKHSNWTAAPIVIDGWHLRPHRMAELNQDRVEPVWLHIAPDVLEARERKNPSWTQNSTDPERMFRNFMARSLWYNDLIRREALRFGMHLLHQDGRTSVEALCDAVLARRQH